MRKLKLQIQTTVDGYMCGPNGEMDWMLFDWSDDVGSYIWDMTGSVDTIVMGRNLAQGFIPHWASKPESEPPEAVEWMNSRAKVVISNTLESSPWESAVIASGDGAESVERDLNERVARRHPYDVAIRRGSERWSGRTSDGGRPLRDVAFRRCRPPRCPS